MFITHCNFVSSNKFSYIFLSSKEISKPYKTTPTLAKKRDFTEATSPQNKLNFPLKTGSSKILVQAVIGVFSLGFIDAGYSGDWSRIGVVTKGTEDLLKVAAFLVVPLCIYLIFSLSKKVEERDDI